MAETVVSAGTSSIEISEAEAFADTDAVFAATVTCDPACDLSGQTLEIRDADGNALAAAELVDFDDPGNHSGEIAIRVPPKAGTVSWTAVLSAHEANGVAYPEVSQSFEVKVKAHPVQMTVWGMPYSAAEGEPVKFKAGVKCAVGCQLAGVSVAVHDDAGKRIATAKAGTEPWEGTDGLFVADFSVPAPAGVGEHALQARIRKSDKKVSHDAGSYGFRVTVTPPPEVIARVEVVDRQTSKPVQGARIVMHPYRAETDADGIATINAAKGDYTIFVSKAKRDPMSTSIALNDDLSTRVELVEEENEFNPDDNY